MKRTQHRPKIRISSPLVMTSFYCAHTIISTSPLAVGAVNHKKNPKFFRLFLLERSYHLNSRGWDKCVSYSNEQQLRREKGALLKQTIAGVHWHGRPLIIFFLILSSNNLYKWGNIPEYTKDISTLRLSFLAPNVWSTIFVLTLLRRH